MACDGNTAYSRGGFLMDKVAILRESERRDLFSETAAKVKLARPSIAEKGKQILPIQVEVNTEKRKHK
jgi:hypothetical protein